MRRGVHAVRSQHTFQVRIEQVVIHHGKRREIISLDRGRYDAGAIGPSLHAVHGDVEITGVTDLRTILEYAADTSAEAYAGIEGVDGSVSEEGGIPG